jgi:hypothetical protein
LAVAAAVVTTGQVLDKVAVVAVLAVTELSQTLRSQRPQTTLL